MVKTINVIQVITNTNMSMIHIYVSMIFIKTGGIQICFVHIAS